MRPFSSRLATLALLGALGLAAVRPAPAAERVDLAQAEAPSASTLPGGASSLNETYEDWTVVCVQQPSGKRCVIAQTQTQQNGQRALTIELAAPAGGVVSGILLLPLGLALEAGATLRVDDATPEKPLSFRTCIPAGCVVPLALDAATVSALRAGAALKVETRADSGKAAAFTIPLRGFASALDRVAALSR